MTAYDWAISDWNSDVCSSDLHRDVGDEEAAEESIDDVGMLLEQERAWLQAVDQQAAEQHRRRVRAGNAEAQRRHQRGAGDGVVGRFRRGHGFRGALAE